jgi:hypothetical protein
MERVFFILTVWPSKIEMKKHVLHASPGAIARDDAGLCSALRGVTQCLDRRRCSWRFSVAAAAYTSICAGGLQVQLFLLFQIRVYI